MEKLPSVNLAELERRAIVQALGETRGNRRQAALALGIDIRTLQRKLRLFGLQDQVAKGSARPNSAVPRGVAPAAPTR